MIALQETNTLEDEHDRLRMDGFHSFLTSTHKSKTELIESAVNQKIANNPDWDDLKKSQCRNDMEKNWTHHRSGGVALYVNESVFPSCREISISTNMVAITATTRDGTTIAIIAVYGPSGEYKENNEFYEKTVEPIVKRANEQGIPAILLGDFNAHVALVGDRDVHRRETKTALSIMCSQHKLIDTGRESNGGRFVPTHWSSSRNARLDYVLINRTFRDTFERGFTKKGSTAETTPRWHLAYTWPHERK